MDNTVHKRPAEDDVAGAKKHKLLAGLEAVSVAKADSTLADSQLAPVPSSKPLLKRKSNDDTAGTKPDSDAVLATPANSVSSTTNSNETPTAPNTRLSSPQHVFGATTSFGKNAGSFSKSPAVAKATGSSTAKPVFGASTSFGSSFSDLKKRPNVFESLPSKLDSTTDTKLAAELTPAISSSFGSNTRFGNAFQNSLTKKSFLDEATDKPEATEPGVTPPKFKQVDLLPVEKKTGEEEERTIHTCTAKIFELDLTDMSAGWKERGLGPLHLNQSIASPEQSRLVMRSQGLLRVVLNMKVSAETQLFKGLVASLSPGKFLRVNSMNEGKPVQYLLKFGSEEIRDGLYDAVEELKKGKEEKKNNDKEGKKDDEGKE